MHEQRVREDVRDIILELAPIQPATISTETLIVIDLGYDSLRLVELIVALENHFDLVAVDEDVLDVETVADVEKRVVAQLSMVKIGTGT